MQQPWENWVYRWEKMIEAISRVGGETKNVLIAPPASLPQVEQIEKTLGVALPPSFRKTVLESSARVAFSWYVPDENEWVQSLPGAWNEAQWGNCSWDLDRLVELNRDKDSWIEQVFPNPEDPYDKVWHNKLAFHDVGNGDYLAFDLAHGPDCPVVYLSHDDGEGHGAILGNDFVDFMDRWTRIGCPGTEDWKMLPFVSSASSGIDPDCENAVKWREWLQLSVE
ncbi:SMI1/KNR4 family protein [Brevibacillus sp. TJ4]|uniref:SMI1/KNR4 family protein n=1 Tax=Brevibacillus sp. TJ4 TaxID=3234853 RepID=UPI0037D72A24